MNEADRAAECGNRYAHTAFSPDPISHTVKSEGLRPGAQPNSTIIRVSASAWPLVGPCWFAAGAGDDIVVQHRR
jgi:hypothetical protein